MENLTPWRETTVNLSSSLQILNWTHDSGVKKNLLRKGKHMHLENGDSSGYPNLNPIACPEKHRKSVPTWPAPGCQPYLWDVMWYHLGWMKHPVSKNYTPPKTNMFPYGLFFWGKSIVQTIDFQAVVVRQCSTVLSRESAHVLPSETSQKLDHFHPLRVI